MENDATRGLAPDDRAWGHAFGPGADGVRLHYVRQGHGAAVLLLHGWPGFWYDWRHVIPLLAPYADVIAPDLRGFGASDKPDRPPVEAYAPEVLAADVMALLTHLGLETVTVAAHDIGATVAQVLARTAPKRVRALALFNPPYPGIGRRRFEPAVQAEAWYQHFHQLPLAEQLVGYNRDTVRLYLAHFYDHWVRRKEAVRPREFEAIVDAYAQPGAVRASIAYYRARASARMREATADAADCQVTQPTTVLWGERDPIMRSAFADRLPEFFPDLTLRFLPDVGHFVPFEAPEDAADAIHRALASAASS